MNTTRGAQARGLWMRAVPFTALRALLFFAAQHPEGLRAKDLDAIAGQLRTSAGKPPARTTRYHYRNVLLGLKILERRGERYFVRRNDPLVEDLLLALRPEEPELTLEERRCFAELVLRNPDCQEHFFSLFADGEPLTDLERFVAQGQPVAWRVLPKSSKAVPESSPETSQSQKRPRRKRRKPAWLPVRIWNLVSNRERLLTTEGERQALLYGIRYWARDELGFIDETFLERYGNVMFPVEMEGPTPDPRVIRFLQERLAPGQEWTTFSLRELTAELCPALKIPVRRFFATLRALHRAYPNWIVWIPTSPSIAAFTAASTFEEQLQLRSYFRDERGRYISHFWAHERLREVEPWNIPIGA